MAPHLWHPLSETTGIVLSEQRTVTGSTELRGTMMIRRDTQWCAMYLEPSGVAVVLAQ